MFSRAASFLVSLILMAYWNRVMSMVRKARRRAGHSANLVPRERTGRWIRIFWIPLIVAWVVLPLLRGLGVDHGFPLKPVVDWPILAWVGVIVAAGAFGATIPCWKTMGKSWRVGINPQETTDLVRTGFYARIRHPIYALSIVLMLGTVAACPTPLMIGIAVIHAILLYYEASREEANLRRIHGQEYEAYCRRTGRFFPRLGHIAPPAHSEHSAQ